jgi:hypothetical protein
MPDMSHFLLFKVVNGGSVFLRLPAVVKNDRTQVHFINKRIPSMRLTLCPPGRDGHFFRSAALRGTVLKKKNTSDAAVQQWAEKFGGKSLRFSLFLELKKEKRPTSCRCSAGHSNPALQRWV